MGYRHSILCLALLTSSVAAQTVGIHTVSFHEHKGFNNTNPGLFIRYDSGLTGGFYLNSHKRDSVYLGYTVETGSFHGISAALTVGGVTGYPDARITPLVVPSLAYHFGNSAIRLGIVPRPPKTGAAAALHLMFEHHI